MNSSRDDARADTWVIRSFPVSRKQKKKEKGEMAARAASGADSVSMSEIRGIRASARRGGSQKRRTLFRELYREANPTFRWRGDKPVSFSRMGVNYRCDD